MTAGKVFPIKSDSICRLAWNLDILFFREGTTRSCEVAHRSSESIDENFVDFHNTPKKINARKTMLKGLWPSQCSVCKNAENNNQLSVRNIANNSLSDREYLDHFNNSEEGTLPTAIELYFDNVCNLSCIYCTAENSSRIEQENNKFPVFQYDNFVYGVNVPRHPQYQQNVELFWIWLNKNYKNLTELFVGGSGEPFYQPEFLKILDFLETQSNQNLTLKVITNLKIDYNKLREFINRIKLMVDAGKIKKFELICSIDCWGKEIEYIRHGLNLTHWKKNFDFLVANDWIDIRLQQTLTSLAIPAMLPLFQLLQSANKIREIKFSSHLVRRCSNLPNSDLNFMSPDIFGAGFFDKFFAESMRYLPINGVIWHNFKQIRNNINGSINKEKNISEIKKLCAFLTEIDRRRGTNWKETFPWLVEEFESIE